MIPCLLAFGAGFVTWSLALVRTLALEGRRVGLLSGLIFTDELATIGIGVYLARSGTVAEIVACAAGGAVAAWVVLRRTR